MITALICNLNAFSEGTNLVRSFPHVLWGGHVTSQGIIDDGDIESLPAVWEARVRCVQFWNKVLTSKVYEDRLLRKVVSQAVECEKGSWMRSIGRCADKFVWQDVSGGVIRELSEAM